MNPIAFSELRARLADALQQVQSCDEPLYISRRGKPAAVLMSVAHYQRLAGVPQGFGAALAAWREQHASALAQALAQDRAPAQAQTQGVAEVEDPPGAVGAVGLMEVRERSTDAGRPPAFADWADEAPEALAPAAGAGAAAAE